MANPWSFGSRGGWAGRRGQGKRDTLSENEKGTDLFLDVQRQARYRRWVERGMSDPER